MTASRPLHVVVTCEHGGNRVPVPYARWFTGCEALLASLRGYDPGALGLARVLAARLQASFHATTVSRLVVEQNRSPGHPQLFSAPMRRAPPQVRDDAWRRYYVPYHEAVVADIMGAIAAGQRVLHLASHSFTPALRGVARRTDIGLLYDPAHRPEAVLCARLRGALASRTGLTVRLNYPYRGTSDGFGTRLRHVLPDTHYLALELEVNQKHVATARWPRLRRAIVDAIAPEVAVLAAAWPGPDGGAASRPRAAAESARRSRAGWEAPGLPAAMRADR
jgi:predicted N-formylglutamate amidohydrolase